jgi:drug/metabolite transporter (DMT)-like permease
METTTGMAVRRGQLGVVAILLVVMIWSGWIVVSSWGVHQKLTPWDITFLRFASAALVTSPLLYRKRNELRSVFNIRVALCGLGCGFPYTMASFIGLSSSPAKNAGVIVNGLLPLLVAALSYLWMDQRISKEKLVGIALIGLANALILYEGGGANINGGLFLFCAALFLAGYTVSMRVWNISVETMIVAVPWTNALLFLPIWLFSPTGIHAATINEIMLQVLYQGVLVSVVALFLMTYAIHAIGSVTASTFMGLVPVVAAFLALVVLHEPFSLMTVLAVLTCSVGIASYNMLGARKAPSGKT